MTKPIIGKVSAVTSDRELLINRGSEHGVEIDMVFRVKGPTIEVTDPDTDEKLGSVTKAKAIVRVVQVDEKFSIARTFRTIRVNVGGQNPGGNLAQILQPPKWETRQETLRRNRSADEKISREQSVVARGDLVESTDEEDIDDETMTIWR